MDSKELFKHLNQVNRLIAACLDTESIAGVVTNQLCPIVCADLCIFAPYQADTQQFFPSSSDNSKTLRPEVLADLAIITSVVDTSGPILLRTKDLPSRSEASIAIRQLGIAQFLLTTISSRNQLQGIMLLGFSDSLQHVNDFEKSVMGFIASQVATSLEKANLIASLKRQNDQLEGIYQSSLKVNAFLHLKEVMESVLDSVMFLFPNTSIAQIFLYDSEKLSLEAARWRDLETVDPVTISGKYGLANLVAQTGEPVIFKNIRNHPIFTDIQENRDQGVVGIPLKSKKIVVGVMNLLYATPHETTEEELRLLSLLGDQATVAIENAKLHQLIESQALTDVLTGIANRRSFETRLRNEILRSARYNHTFGLVLFDIDNFKKINDTYGHPWGDKYLVQFVNRMSSEIRDTDFLARIGGDEFAIILPESNLEHATRLATRLDRVITEYPYNLPDKRILQHSASFGIAIYPEQAKNAEDLMSFADQALYLYKRQKDMEKM